MLILNHKRAIEYLWSHPGLTLKNVCAMHALLTDDRQVPEVASSDHFLPSLQRGRPPEDERVRAFIQPQVMR